MRRKTLARTLSGVVGITVILNSCAPTSVATPGAEPPVPGEHTSTTATNDWAPQQVTETGQFVIEDSTTISISGDSSHTSSFQTTTLYSLTVTAQGDSFSLTAKVDSTSTTSRAPTRGSGTERSSHPVTHATISRSGQISTLTEETASLCQGGLDAAATRVFEVTQNYPRRHVKIGDVWSDTVFAISCRGKTPLHQQIVREFTLLELTTWKKYDVAKVRRVISSAISGDNQDPRSSLSAVGSGTGSAILYVDRATGFLRESDGQTEATLIIKTSRGSYPFSQKMSTHIELQ